LNPKNESPRPFADLRTAISSSIKSWKVTVYVEGSGHLREPTTPTAIAAATEREDGTGPRRDIWWYGRGK